MNLQQLEYIQALGLHRHFGKAAEHCNVTQPTLSTMVLKLEDELGARLFDRTKQPIEPTPLGEKVLAQATIILRQTERMREIVQEEKNALGGKITLAVLPTIAPYLLPTLIPILERELPKLKITFIELKTSDCIARLEQNDIDLAIIASDIADSLTECHPLYYEEFYGYVSESEEIYTQDSVRTAEVNADHLWLLDEGHCFRDQLMRFCSLSRSSSKKHNYTRGSLETFMHMVEKGHGLTFIPELCMHTLGKGQERFVRPFAIPRPTRRVCLYHRQDFARCKLRDKLIELISHAVPEEMLRLKSTQTLV